MKKSSYKKVTIVHFIYVHTVIDQYLIDSFLFLTVVQVSSGHAAAAQPCASEGTDQGSGEHCGGGLEK